MKREEHAARMWIILTSAALNRQILNYKHLSEQLGIPPQGLGPILAHLLVYCRNKGLPPLTVLVVTKNSGTPGDGFGDQADLNTNREKVFAYRWYDVPAPRAAELTEDR